MSFMSPPPYYYHSSGYPPAGWTWTAGVAPNSYAVYYQNYPVAVTTGEDPLEAEPDYPNLTRQEVLQSVQVRLFGELKVVAERDCQKKLIEKCAFQVLEEWVAERDQKRKEVQANDRLVKLKAASAGHAGGASRSTEGQTSCIFGLGFRATIPRVPSFRKRRSPSQDRIHGSSHDGDDDGNDQDRQRDKWLDDDSFEAPRQRRRSVSSESSSSTASSSSKHSEEEESVEEHEDTPATKKVKVELEETTPTSTPSKKAKVKRVRSASPSPERVPEPETETGDFDVDIESPDDLEQIEQEPEKSTKTFESAHAEVTSLDHSYASLAPRPEPEPLPVLKGRGKSKSVAHDAKHEPLQFKPRTEKEINEIIFDFLKEGIDQEDWDFIKRSYEVATSPGREDVDPNLTKMHWVEHPVTKIDDHDHKVKIDSWKRVNTTGSCRTEGYYKYTPEDKMKAKQDLIAKLGNEIRNKPASTISHSLHLQSGNKNQRRLMTEFGDNDSESLKFNQLRFRKKKKALRFARSYIHDWGLFAAEPIGAYEMVIEYVGEVIRSHVSDWREKAYEKEGIMSSYLFRLDGDEDLVVDATKCGNLARFINHSCSPNCVTKTVTVEGQKKIMIYSKQDIAVDEELTYDYKFPLEDEKIKCLCGAPTCRGFLN